MAANASRPRDVGHRSGIPLTLRVGGRRCAVIGAGGAAEPRIDDLAAAGAALTVIAPDATVRVRELAAQGHLTLIERTYRIGDLAGVDLAYAATGDDAVHAEIANEASRTGTWLNVVDRPQWCDFTTPAVVRRGRLTVAISTGGASPALARRIRLDLEEQFGPEYEQALELLARLRPLLATRGLSFADKQARLGRLVGAPLLDSLRRGDGAAVDRLLAEVDPGLSLAAIDEYAPEATS